ncbi:MAG: hypothetical protein EA381_11125 [Planctomycetaceae bacterium]|nr:MAG: hypothetical protein EA381_11125 [Planctomycetaceae bacterium]
MAELIDPTDQTGKMRVRRIRLDYYRDRGRYHRWRWFGAILAALTIGLYLGWVSWSPAGVRHLSTGPLSRAHAALETNCQACHVDFTPIAANAWRLQPAAAAQATAAKCRECHREVGHHVANLNDAGTLVDSTCAGCHQEHRGLAHGLIPRDDRTCIDCHRETANFRTADATGSAAPIGNVSGFTKDGHGEFRSLVSLRRDGANASEPGDKGESSKARGSSESEEAIVRPFEFDHALHMLPGQVAEGRRGAMRLDRMSPEHRERYRRDGQADDAIVQLACADCHDFGMAGAGGRGDGESAVWGTVSQPIRYDQHCVACHPLTAPGQRQDQFGLPHGQPLERLRELLVARAAVAGLGGGETRRAARRDAGGTTTGSSDPFPLRIPGREGGGSNSEVPGASRRSASETDLAAASAGWDGLVRGVEQQCRVCHTSGELDRLVGSPRTPRPTLRLGRYDHSAHREMSCVVCHPQADPQGRTLEGTAQAAWSQWVGQFDHPSMILGIGSCTPCHRGGEPERTLDAALTGGMADRAPDRCTTCHSYHQRGSGGIPFSPEARELTGPEPDLHRLTLHGSSLQRLPLPTPTEHGDSRREDSAAAQTLITTMQAVESRSGGWLGRDSCAASTCHGGPLRSDSDGVFPHWNSSQTAFEAHDPHGRSGSTLAGDWSRRIVIGLDATAASSAQRFHQVVAERCASCHSPREHSHRDTAEVGSAGLWEGVSCEACHGPAAEWLEPHLKSDWQVTAPMRDLGRYVARVETCVRCHVGSRREDGVIRDMNHDLIAAGHPALRFEPWSALQRLPLHGGGDLPTDGLATLDGESERRRQSVGRLIALRAAVRLTGERFQDLRQSSVVPAAVWPELSDYDCFACHQPLRIADVGVRPRPGFPTPHAWLQAGLHDTRLGAAFPLDASRWEKAMETFRLRAAGAGEIAAATREAEAVLDRWLKRLVDPAPLPDEWLVWQAFPVDASAGSESLSAGRPDWHHAAQWYLGAHAALRDGPPAADPQAVAEVLDRLADRLRFGQTDGVKRGESDSPERFDRQVFGELADELIGLADREGAR